MEAAIVWGWHRLYMLGWESVRHWCHSTTSRCRQPLRELKGWGWGGKPDVGLHRLVLCTVYTAQRFVSSRLLCGESCGYVEVGMMVSETVFHFFHIKVTVGDVKVGGGFCAGFLWKTLAYLAFTFASRGWNSLLKNRRGFLNKQQVVKRRTVRTR